MRDYIEQKYGLDMDFREIEHENYQDYCLRRIKDYKTELSFDSNCGIRDERKNVGIQLSVDADERGEDDTLSEMAEEINLQLYKCSSNLLSDIVKHIDMGRRWDGSQTVLSPTEIIRRGGLCDAETCLILINGILLPGVYPLKLENVAHRLRKEITEIIGMITEYEEMEGWRIYGWDLFADYCKGQSSLWGGCLESDRLLYYIMCCGVKGFKLYKLHEENSS